jgi:WD40 repeat protein
MMKLVGNQSKIRSVGFFNSDKHVVSTSNTGEISIFDFKTGDLVYHNEVMGERDEYEGNIAYCVRPLTKIGRGLQFMTGHQDCIARSWEFDPDNNDLKELDQFIGHSNTIRNICKFVIILLLLNINFSIFTKRKDMCHNMRRSFFKNMGHEEY